MNAATLIFCLIALGCAWALIDTALSFFGADIGLDATEPRRHLDVMAAAYGGKTADALPKRL